MLILVKQNPDGTIGQKSQLVGSVSLDKKTIKGSIESKLQLIGHAALGRVEDLGATYLLVDEAGNEIPAVLVDTETIFTANENDIRAGKIAANETGIVVGTKDIPSYHTTEGYVVVPNGRPFVISPPPNDLDLYAFTKLQALICPFNKTLNASVAVEKVAINEAVYNVMSADMISQVTRDHANNRIDLGVVNSTGGVCIVRYFTYKEVI